MLLIGTPFFIFFGWLSDRVGRLKIIMAGCALAALTYLPLFQGLAHYVNPALEQYQAATPITVAGFDAAYACKEKRGLFKKGEPPLRLLAREVYDKIAARAGVHNVALITGEERIVPQGARYFLCTAESMPVQGDRGDDPESGRDFAFAAIDEAQLGIDPERGHVFTDRMLRARGREETLILGSATLKPIIRDLLPEAEIVSRPRFSTLRYAGSVKLSRLPPRSAVVAFSAEQVYALAEMLRRFKGGAAVVMGALSPATRNAQVDMFQRGEVDYLVATDAIGMGLNMDVTHVAFAGLEKFDGRRDRRLHISEMAQIAGRAGRHQRDGSFGTLGLGGQDAAAFSDEEISAIEEHRFRPLDFVYWRNSDLDFTDVKALIASLERKSDDPLLRPAPEAIDLAVLKLIADDPAVAAKRGAVARRLWAVCGLPDFRKVGPMHHSRMVRRLFSYVGEGGHVPHEWFAAEVARLDNVAGDIEALADRLAGIRSWAYIAQRADWLADPGKWAERTKAVEARLSDALHERLTQRFVDRRTAVLVRDIGARGADALPVTVAADGEVSVGPEPIGHLAGFEFRVDPSARLADKRLLLAAAERRLGDELDRRAAKLCDAPDAEFRLVEEEGGLAIGWDSQLLARLAPGRSLLSSPCATISRSAEPPGSGQSVSSTSAVTLGPSPGQAQTPCWAGIRQKVRAASARRRISRASCHTLLFCASRITGTIRPLSVCVAMPRWSDPWRVITPASSSKVALSIGHSGSALAMAVIRKGRTVSLGLSPRSRFIIARVSSSAVTSNSSTKVKCGMRRFAFCMFSAILRRRPTTLIVSSARAASMLTRIESFQRPSR